MRLAFSAAPINSPSVVTSRQKDFPSVARRLVKFLIKTILKKDAYLFEEPVDASVEAVKDYYDVVPHGPISFKMIDQNQPQVGSKWKRMMTMRVMTKQRNLSLCLT